MNLEKNKYMVNNYLHQLFKNNVLKIVVTDGTTEIARSFLYRILTDDVFGKNQCIFVSLYELSTKTMFLESLAIELNSFSPKLLSGISYSNNAFEFKDADVVICIGHSREYNFKEPEYTESFFKDYVLISKFYGQIINKYVKKDARIIVLGNTAAMIISKYAKSIPIKNITTLSMLNLNIVKTQIAARANCLPTEVKNIIIWGSNGTYCFPDCRYLYLTNGKPLEDSLKIWIYNDLPRIIQSTNNRSCLINSIAYALAEHCKILWNGTPENEWTSMGVLSDLSYSIQSGIFFSFPVICKDKQCEIIRDFELDEYAKKYIVDLSRLIFREIQIALEICGLISHDD